MSAVKLHVLRAQEEVVVDLFMVPEENMPPYAFSGGGVTITAMGLTIVLFHYEVSHS